MKANHPLENFYDWPNEQLPPKTTVFIGIDENCWYNYPNRILLIK